MHSRRCGSRYPSAGASPAVKPRDCLLLSARGCRGETRLCEQQARWLVIVRMQQQQQQQQR